MAQVAFLCRAVVIFSVMICRGISLNVNTDSGNEEFETEMLKTGNFKTFFRHKRATAGTPVPFTQAEQDAGLKQHNDYRAAQGASNMEYMEWHPELARMAQDYANGCFYEHSSQTNDGCYNVSYTNVGENLHYNTAKVDLVSAVTAWYVEVNHYDFDNATCAEGKICGHYTQVVWWNSELVGCGRAKCPELEEYTGVAVTDAYFTSCNYGARGNYGNNRPFTKGAACSSCASGLTECKDGMCYKSGVDYQRPADKLKDCVSTKDNTEDTEPVTESAGSKTDNTDTKTDNTDTKTDNTDTKTDNTDTKTDNTDTKTDNTDTKTDNTDTKTDNTESKTDNTDTKTDNTDTKTDNTDTKTDNTDTKTDNTDTKTDNTDTKTDNTDTKTDNTESKTDNTDTKTDNTDTKTDNTDTKTDNTESKTENTDTDAGAGKSKDPGGGTGKPEATPKYQVVFMTLYFLLVC